MVRAGFGSAEARPPALTPAIAVKATQVGHNFPGADRVIVATAILESASADHQGFQNSRISRSDFSLVADRYPSPQWMRHSDPDHLKASHGAERGTLTSPEPMVGIFLSGDHESKNWVEILIPGRQDNSERNKNPEIRSADLIVAPLFLSNKKNSTARSRPQRTNRQPKRRDFRKYRNHCLHTEDLRST